jgi:hypothetical protein
MDPQTKHFIVRCASAFLYKETYFKSSKGLTPNTWSFIITQNMKQPGCISLTNVPEEKLAQIYVRLSGTGPIDFSKLSKRPKRRIPLMPIYYYINENGSTDSDEEFSR